MSTTRFSIVGLLWWMSYGRLKIAKIVFFSVVTNSTKTFWIGSVLYSANGRMQRVDMAPNQVRRGGQG